MEQIKCNVCGSPHLKRIGGSYKCLSCDHLFKVNPTDEEYTLLTVASDSLLRQEFGTAEEQFSEIVRRCPENHAAYWGLVCARYGIRYEEDYNGKRIPTCCMPTVESFSDDPEFLSATKYAPDEETQTWYRQQAEYIDRIRKIWIDKASKEPPYDIFICYKDSDREHGIERTQDSLDAADLYLHLNEKYRVFYSRESLRDKIGEKYEPYIFQALQTAKVMIVYGTSAENITSTWLKNEWLRYSKLIRDGKKREDSLIVACDGFNPTELPRILSSRQCLNAAEKTFFLTLDAKLDELFGKSAEQKKEAPPRNASSSKRHASALPPRQSVVRVFEDRYSKADSNKARIGIIRSFIIPSSPEDLLEFAVLAASNVDESLLNASIFSQNNRMTLKEQFGLDASLKQVNDAWMFKLGQVYQQANAAIPGTPELDKIEELYYQKKQTGRKKKTSSTARTATPAPSRKPNPAAVFKHRKTKNVTEKRKEVLIVVLALLAVLLLAGGGMGMLAYMDYKDTKAAQTPMPIPPVVNESGPYTIEAGRQYAFMSDEWDVYIANAISDSIIKIEYWHKSDKSKKDLKYSSDVGTYLINDEENGFGWLDEQHTAFVFTFKDNNSGRVKKAAPHVFTINLNDSNTYKGTDYDERIACYLYTCDNWHMYRAIPLSESLIKIECWSRSSTDDKFCFGWDWYVINWNSNETDFTWLDDAHSGFTVTTKDSQNRYYWKQETLVAFTLENGDYSFESVSAFLNAMDSD